MFFQSLFPILYFLMIKVSLNPLLYSFVTSLSLSFCFSSVKLDGWRLFNKIQSTLQIRDWNPIIKSAAGGDLSEKVFLKISQISQKKHHLCWKLQKWIFPAKFAKRFRKLILKNICKRLLRKYLCRQKIHIVLLYFYFWHDGKNY